MKKKPTIIEAKKVTTSFFVVAHKGIHGTLYPSIFPSLRQAESFAEKGEKIYEIALPS